MNILSAMRAMRPLAMLFFCMTYVMLPMLLLTGTRDHSLLVMIQFGIVVPTIAGMALACSLHQLVHRGTTPLLPRAVSALRAAWITYAAIPIGFVTLLSLKTKLGLGVALTGPALICISLPLLDSRRKELLGGRTGYPLIGWGVFACVLLFNAKGICQLCIAHQVATLMAGAGCATVIVWREFRISAFRKRQELVYMSDIALGLLGNSNYQSLAQFRKIENASMKTKRAEGALPFIGQSHGSVGFWYATLSQLGQTQSWLKGRPLAVALRINALCYGGVFAVIALVWMAWPERFFPLGFAQAIAMFLGEGVVPGLEVADLSLVCMFFSVPLLYSSVLMGSHKLRPALNIPVSRSLLFACMLRHAGERYAGHLVAIAIPTMIALGCAAWNGAPIGYARFAFAGNTALIILPLLGLAACATHFRSKLILPLLCGGYCGLTLSMFKDASLLAAGPLFLLTVFLSATAILLGIDLLLTRRHILRGDLTEDLRELA